MTPFNPTALLAMLLTFYPLVSVAELQRARRERPDYFAGGVLFGTTGEKLRLPDGRVFDLIFDASNPDPTRRRWQVIEPGPGRPDDETFPLERGPFTPIDGSTWPVPSPTPIFTPLVAGALATLGDADGLFGRAASTITEASSPAALTTMFHSTIDKAEGTVGSSRNRLNAADPSDIIVASGGQAPTINKHEGDYTEEPPRDGPPRPVPIPEPRRPELS